MAFENIVGKEEIARNEQFLLFPQCFLHNQKIVSPCVNFYDISFFATELEEPKIGIPGKGLMVFSFTLYQILHWSKFQSIPDNKITATGKFEIWLTLSQTANYRLFQTEGVCRRQFQVQFEWLKVPQMGRKHCGKSRNCLLRVISPFATVFYTDFSCRHVKIRACLGKG